MKIYFDGGCRPNPGQMETAVVAGGKLYHRRDIGYGSSEEAEWRALLHAIDVAILFGASDVQFVGDSLSVIARANRRSTRRRQVPDRLLTAFEEQARQFTRVRLRHVSRTQNLAGIALARFHGR